MSQSTQDKAESLARQMAVRVADIASARQAHAEACLALSDDDNPNNRNVVSVLEQEIAEHEQAITRLKVAQQALADGVSVKATRDRLAKAQTAANAAKAVAPRIRATLERVIAAFEDVIGPGLAEIDALQREQSTEAWAAIAATIERRDIERTGSRVRSMTDDSAITAALLSAVVRSGLGSIGPSMAPHVSISAPFSGVSTPERALESLDMQAEKISSYLDEVLARATNPATDDLE